MLRTRHPRRWSGESQTYSTVSRLVRQLKLHLRERSPHSRRQREFFVPGYSTPRNASPASERSSASGISGSRKKLSPHSLEQAAVPARHKRSSRGKQDDETGERIPAVPLVTSAHLHDVQGSAESAMSTDSAAGLDRRLRKLVKKDEQIRVLLEQSASRVLNVDEQAKVSSHASIQLEIQMLRASMPESPPAGISSSTGSARSAAPTMPAAASAAVAVAASQSELDELTPPPTRVGTRNSAIEVRPPCDACACGRERAHRADHRTCTSTHRSC